MICTRRKWRAAASRLIGTDLAPIAPCGLDGDGSRSAVGHPAAPSVGAGAEARAELAPLRRAFEPSFASEEELLLGPAADPGPSAGPTHRR